MWVNSTLEAATWEDWPFLRRKFKGLDPWGQGSSQEGGIVKDNMDLEGNVQMVEGGLGEEESKDEGNQVSVFHVISTL